MEIKLQGEDRFRINGGYCDYSNFIDISKAGYSGICTTLFSGFQYIEIRKKDDQLRIYTFPKKSHKKDYDFSNWVDAEVVFSLNEQIMNKE